MVTYTYNKPTEARHTHSVLIGTPLILVLVFAFGFVLMQPAASGGETAAANHPTSNAHKAPRAPAATLAPLPQADTTLPTLTPAPASGDGSGSTSADATASLQAAGNSSASANSPNVQSAIPNSSAANPKAPLSAKHSSSHSLLQGFLKVL